MPVILWNTNVIEEEGEHVQAFWVMREEVKDPPILLDVRLGVGFKCMDHIWEFHSITNKEDREIVSNKIKITLSSQEKVRNDYKATYTKTYNPKLIRNLRCLINHTNINKFKCKKFMGIPL